MPFEEVGFKGCRMEGGVWVRLKLCRFFEDASYRG